jgi:hypothetical protein
MDLASRRVVGWATADHLRTELVDQALTNTVTRRRPPHGVIFRPDRGCQYISAPYRRLADRHGVRLSVGPRSTSLAKLGPPPTRKYLPGARAGHHPPPTLHTGLPQPRHLRSENRPDRPTPGSLTPHQPCPSERGTPTAATAEREGSADDSSLVPCRTGALVAESDKDSRVEVFLVPGHRLSN